jgi:hypothetical protein
VAHGHLPPGHTPPVRAHVTPLQPQPYRLNVQDNVLDDLRERLTRTRWADEIPESGWQYASNLAYMRRLTERWRDGFDWRAQEAKLIRHPPRSFAEQVFSIQRWT